MRMKKRIVIIDYGLGNLRSVLRGLERAGGGADDHGDPEAIASADGIVLPPGVGGAFRDGMEMLGGLADTVLSAANETPLLGICLGMQMLMDSSEEHGIHRGLGLVPGDVKRFIPAAGGEKVPPHMAGTPSISTPPKTRSLTGSTRRSTSTSSTPTTRRPHRRTPSRAPPTSTPSPRRSIAGSPTVSSSTPPRRAARWGG